MAHTNGNNTDLLAALASIRAERARLCGDRAGILEAPLPKDEVVERMRAYVERVGDLGVTTIRERALSFVTAHGVPRPDPFWLLGGGDPWNLAIIVHRLCAKPLLAELEAGLAGIDFTQAIPAAERREELDRLEAEIATVEKREELAVRALEAAGVDIVRRPDCDPALVVAEDGELAA
jgi:hypothetical protein